MSKRRKQKELFLDELADRPQARRKEKDTRNILDLLDSLPRPANQHRSFSTDGENSQNP